MGQNHPYPWRQHQPRSEYTAVQRSKQAAREYMGLQAVWHACAAVDDDCLWLGERAEGGSAFANGELHSGLAGQSPGGAGARKHNRHCAAVGFVLLTEHHADDLASREEVQRACEEI